MTDLATDPYWYKDGVIYQTHGDGRAFIVHPSSFIVVPEHE